MRAELRVVLAVLVVLTSWSVRAQHSGAQQWLIEAIDGVWEVQEAGQKPRSISGKYDVLTVGSKIRCLKLPCKLTYSSGDGSNVQPLPFTQLANQRLNKWLNVPVPAEPATTPTVPELQDLVNRLGVRGGARKGAITCSGKLPLLAPGCGETIDPEDFRVKWSTNSSEAGKSLTLLMGSADSMERKRWNAIPVDAGEYRNEAIGRFLQSLQPADHRADVTIRLMRSENLDGIRLVVLPSRAESAEYHRKLTSFTLLPELARNIKTMDLYLKMGMWSKAADMSRQLLRDAPDSLEIRKYAMIGLCPSDFADEVAALRTSLADAGIRDVCQVEPQKQ
jgi:hypothetical protein